MLSFELTQGTLFRCAGRRLICGAGQVVKVQGILTKISSCAADLKECGDDRKKLARQEAVAAMCLGEDAEEVGGVRSNETWFDQQKTNACGKLQVCLLKFLFRFLISLCIQSYQPNSIIKLGR